MKRIFAAIAALLGLFRSAVGLAPKARSIEAKTDLLPAPELDELPTETRAAVVPVTHDHEAAVLAAQLLIEASQERIDLMRNRISCLHDDDYDWLEVRLILLAGELHDLRGDIGAPGKDLLEVVNSIKEIDRVVRAVQPRGWNIPGRAGLQEASA